MHNSHSAYRKIDVARDDKQIRPQHAPILGDFFESRREPDESWLTRFSLRAIVRLNSLR
jgi:hypothetical protein